MSAIRTYALFFGFAAVWVVIAGWSLSILGTMPFPKGHAPYMNASPVELVADAGQPAGDDLLAREGAGDSTSITATP